MKKRVLTLLSACALLFAGGSAHGSLIDFSTDQTGLFDSNGGTAYTYSATAGIGGTGGLLGGVDGAVWSYNGASYTFDGPEDEITFSMDTRYDDAVGSAQIPLRLGLQGNGPEGFGDFAVRLDSRENFVEFEENDNTTPVSNISYASNMTDGNWYRGEFTITGTGNTSTTGEFGWSYNVFDLGAAGLSIPSSIASASGTSTNNYFLNSDTEPLEFSFKVNAAASEIDNIGITVIPEPSAVALMLLGALSTLLVVRRRRS